MASSAADVRAGGAFYELYGKDKLTPLLETVKKNAESFGGLMKNVGKRAGAGADAALGGIKEGLKGLAMSLGQEAFKGVVSLISGLEALKKEYEKTARAIAAVDAATERNMKKRGELIEAEIDPKKKALAIDKEVAKLEKERDEAQGVKNQFQEQKDRLGMFKEKGTTGERFKSFGLWVGGNQEDAVADIQQRIDAANATRDKAFAKLQELSEQRGRLLNPDNDPVKTKAVAELTRELKKQADTFQQTAEQVKLYEMGLEGFSKAQIAAVAAAQGQLHAQQAVGGGAAELFSIISGTAKDLVKEVDETTKALKEQADTFGLSAERAALLKLKLKGLTDAQLAPLLAQVERTEYLSKLAGAADAIANGVASAERLTLASPGTFDAGNAAQRYGSDTLSQKTIKAAEETAKNTNAMVKGLAELAKGLRFK